MFPFFFLSPVLSPLSSAVAASPRGLMAAPSSLPPWFCLEICPPVWAGLFHGPPAAQLPPASGTGTPPASAQQRGQKLLREPSPHLSLSVHTAFPTGSPLLPQDQAHFTSNVSSSHRPSKGCGGVQKGPQFSARGPRFKHQP